jgi:single-stranded-DNA-specific exonuclease
MSKIIKIIQADRELRDNLARELNIPAVLAQVLVNRGINSAGQAEAFLRPKFSDLLSPWQMKDMDKAVSRIIEAGKQRERVLIFGDYDVDGVTALCLLKIRLQQLGIPVMHYIPHRLKEGYGLNLSAGQIARKKGIKLIITVDCGINSYDLVKRFRRWGIDVIITDHHQPQDKLPPAYAIINPKQSDCAYEYKNLAGVGVAYKLAQAITRKDLRQDLDLVALGTIADSVALNGENRIIVREGLNRLSSSPRLGLSALMQAAGINKQGALKTTAVSYILGPRLNAGGRIDTAESALQLLLSQSEKEAEELARILNSHNRKRQKIEERILKEALSLIDREVNFKEHYIIVVSGRDWHPGVLGIAASRIMDRFSRPAILLSESAGKYCRGSARSIKDFSIFEALVHCRAHLKDFGGHRLAAGLTIAKKNIDGFRRDINHFARRFLIKNLLLPAIEADMEIALSDLSQDLIYQLKDLEPFGSDNPEPLFYTRNLRLRGKPQALSRDTLKFWVTDYKSTYQAIGFGLAAQNQRLLESESFDLVYHPEIDTWQGNHNPILEVRDIACR